MPADIKTSDAGIADRIFCAPWTPLAVKAHMAIFPWGFTMGLILPALKPLQHLHGSVDV
jgi:hypothetical protein